MCGFQTAICVRKIASQWQEQGAIQCVPATDACEKEKKKSFHKSVQEATDHTPESDTLVTIRNWNAKTENKTEPNLVGKFDLEIRNKTEKWFIEIQETSNRWDLWLRCMLIAEDYTHQNKVLDEGTMALLPHSGTVVGDLLLFSILMLLFCPRNVEKSKAKLSGLLGRGEQWKKS